MRIKGAGPGVLTVAFATIIVVALAPVLESGDAHRPGRRGQRDRSARFRGMGVYTGDAISRHRSRFAPEPSACVCSVRMAGPHVPCYWSAACIPDGIDEPRLMSLARELAATGVVVVTPEIDDLTQLQADGARHRHNRRRGGLDGRAPRCLWRAAHRADRRELLGRVVGGGSRPALCTRSHRVRGVVRRAWKSAARAALSVQRQRGTAPAARLRSCHCAAPGG